MLTVNAMTTADTVLVPIQCEYYALEGLSQLIHTVNLVRERLNPTLDIEEYCSPCMMRGQIFPCRWWKM